MSSDDLPAPSRGNTLTLLKKQFQSVRHDISFSQRKFDIATLDEDMQRVYAKLENDHGETYALLWIFSMRTAIELHRGWHMTLLTSKLLQQIKEKFNMRMSWNLGVLMLIFRVEDGGYELRRKVPYDYDSEFQDLYYKIAVALVDGKIDVHQALIFQSETKDGIHTAKSGLFIRRYPGRLLVYPIEAATCAMIFFGGDLHDAGVAALCGLVAGCIEWMSQTLWGEHKILLDLSVGVSTGIIAGLFYRFYEDTFCLSSIFMGVLYWFFYGTAFVVGILEIVAGELETGVIRFIAVSIKTFVLSLGGSIGLKIACTNAFQAWREQANNCNQIVLGDMWWRIPLYLACSASALAQYRFPVINYWRGLVVQLVGYEVQYQSFNYFSTSSSSDFLDTAYSNILGGAASVLAAAALAAIVDRLMFYYNARLLQRETEEFSKLGEFIFSATAISIRLFDKIGIGRHSDVVFLDMEKKLREQRKELKDPSHARQNIVLTDDEEIILVEAIISAEDINIWSVLMPTVYQLVPGSIIARLWFNTIFPPPLFEAEVAVRLPNSDLTISSLEENTEINVFSNLMVISISLALGLLIGFALVGLCNFLHRKTIFIWCCFADEDNMTAQRKRARKEMKADRANRKVRESVVTANLDDGRTARRRLW